jgi:probable HAF family extracellular repeat protein
VPHDLGTLGARDSHAAAVNDAGEVVGWSRTAGHDQHAFVVLPGDGSMRDLNRLIPRRLGLVLVQASGVNDRGEIAATALPAAGGPSRAVLLVPR